MKIRVTGCNGFLGSIFCLTAQETKDRVLGTQQTSRFVPSGCETKTLDIRNLNACLEVGKAFKPDVIINCARYTVNVGQCERACEFDMPSHHGQPPLQGSTEPDNLFLTGCLVRDSPNPLPRIRGTTLPSCITVPIPTPKNHQEMLSSLLLTPSRADSRLKPVPYHCSCAASDCRTPNS